MSDNERLHQRKYSVYRGAYYRTAFSLIPAFGVRSRIKRHCLAMAAQNP